jgi:hypothetical protein
MDGGGAAGGRVGFWSDKGSRGGDIFASSCSFSVRV